LGGYTRIASPNDTEEMEVFDDECSSDSATTSSSEQKVVLSRDLREFINGFKQQSEFSPLLNQ